MYLDAVVLIVELLCHDLNKIVPFTQAKSLIKHGKLFLPYFNTWIRKFHQNCRVLTNVLGRPTSRFKVEARARAQKRGHWGLLMNRIPIQAKILICNYLLQHEFFWTLQAIQPLVYAFWVGYGLHLMFFSCMHPFYIHGKLCIFVYIGLDLFVYT